MRSGFSSDDSDSMDESENGYLEEDIQSLIKESNKKIQADTKQQKSGQGIFTRDYSADKPNPKLVLKQPPATAFKKAPQASLMQTNDKSRPATSAKPNRGIDKTKAYELFDDSDEERPHKPSTLISSKIQKESGSQVSQSTGISKRPSTSTTPQSTNASTMLSSRPNSSLTPSKQPQQLEKLSPSRQAAPSKERQPLADLHTSHARDTSTDTVKKKTTPKKGKLKHKVAVACYHERSEIPLVRHFIELGEWKRVLKFDDADFTFVNNERKLDWDVALKTMVD